ncbi:MAG: phosphoenolpyruvate--protein phosphotransferase [Lachnospiraceae bacterium]|jgi:phosphotransferase system enzyme I (PtsI)|uniref:Phosphoenolpyruvate--protein phosphotransferase n=1 Tax=Hominisplanchenecus murintestinalis TaxID=2941517 RepID=A0AC61R2Q6_9FIRM|nr:phosphoenolpyruvate--protein phosphotransferase [Hominisplanchenecus murintestinalis]MCI9515478.1 phosphoenolpyruvate--protein phosphotransferase [Lachnospiraceae bacterium]RKJ88755.1 phosphoenolpyruvate--protein phosphotransferase [Anaerotruncus sp. 1XD22-93]MCI9660309.1 phosphoenolpyruvate--protein phosphotransferase [Lachnospiraceae bacterium]NBH98611.1 phosphoenolpyruvate--protein phosphotransferase [Lachnospiraceae bacterium]NBI75805.1 phosphoenolpyruvate--protein phosphotransferase [L
MITLQGKGVFGGVAIGKISFYKRTGGQIQRRKIDNPAAEIARFEEAKAKAIEQLDELYNKAVQEVGEGNAMIFQVHQMMLDDLDYVEAITNMITTQEINAEFAVGTTGDNFSQMFASMDDEYMRERAADVKDISERVVSILSGSQEGGLVTDTPVILASDDLAPSETVQLDKDMVLSFVTQGGSTNSHTAILARTMNIPAIIGLGEGLTEEYEGKMGIVDGATGKLFIEPDEETLKEYREKQAEYQEKQELLQKLKGEENISLDGQKVKLYANIGNASDIGAVLQNDAAGIGLFRSEFLYLENDDFPTEEEQFKVYKYVAETMAGKQVIIRTLDIGADKQIDYFNLPKEENPAMGYRAIRICLTQKDIFKTQLRALFRASAFGNIAIMFPMIIALEEVLEIKEIVEEVKKELDDEGIPYNKETQLGIMIETPAAAVISDDLAKEVDFFSVGTNDLTQYTTAVDRQNANLEKFYHPHHKALLRLIKMAADNAHKNGIWIGICGELGADMELTEAFLAMGIDELSVSPACILPLRKKIRETGIADRREEILADVLG